MSARPSITDIHAAERDRAHWLAKRRLALGSSDIPAILGRSPFRTPLQIYYDKLGLLPDEPENSEQRRGKRLQPLVLADYQDETGRTVDREECYIRNPALPIAATLDAVCTDKRRVEAKTVGFSQAKYWGEEYTDNIPVYVILQCQTQFLATDWDREAFHDDTIDVPVLFWGEKYKTFTVARDPELQGIIAEEGTKFWELVEARTPPAPEAEDIQTINKLFPEPKGECRLGSEYLAKAEHFEEVKLGIKQMKEVRDRLKAEMLAAMEDYQIARLPGNKYFEKLIVNIKEHPVNASRQTRFYIKESR